MKFGDQATNTFRIYPPQIATLNPNPYKTGILQAEFSSLGSFLILEATGKVVYQKAKLQGKESLSLNLKPGFYFAKAQTEKGSQTVELGVGYCRKGLNYIGLSIAGLVCCKR